MTAALSELLSRYLDEEFICVPVFDQPAEVRRDDVELDLSDLDEPPPPAPLDDDLGDLERSFAGL